MVNYTSLLEGALIDYADWVSRGTSVPLGGQNELRGIFFNKLITRLNEVHSIYELRHSIFPVDILVTFKPEGHIASLRFLSGPSIGAKPCRLPILNGLNESLGEIDVQGYNTPLACRLTKIIHELKNTV